MAYNNDVTMSVNEEAFQYIDYAVHERLVDMKSSREFWQLKLKGYNMEQPLSLPADRQPSLTDQRSGVASTVRITLNNDIATAFLNYASVHEVTPFQLGLATFYAFLFKLTHGQNDLCIACLNANRYRSELENMIGMFVATLPYRIQLDSQWPFDELVKHVREKCVSILEHSHYPLQHILADSHLNQLNVSFFRTVFDFITISLNIDQLFFDGATLEEVPIEQSLEVAKFDFFWWFAYNPTLNHDRLSCCLTCSRDLFDERTVATIARRFEHLFSQLFSSNGTVTESDACLVPISQLSLLLPEEVKEMEDISFRRQSNIVNEGTSICF
jgi:non-ribosomal peptide synthetase component F